MATEIWSIYVKKNAILAFEPSRELSDQQVLGFLEDAPRRGAAGVGRWPAPEPGEAEAGREHGRFSARRKTETLLGVFHACRGRVHVPLEGRDVYLACAIAEGGCQTRLRLTENRAFDLAGLPGIGWGISWACGEGGRIEIKSAEVKEDCHFEPLAVSEPSSEDFDFLDL